ncbi:toxin-antitoxin system YwqK family antitoxin [Saezia sanguinis]|uniref:toxin-antitoxin system YwqK family antitoxin n=1 Tax=Saezia sanguinis TaxID=1965230 RepID=UPI0030652EDE
MEKVLLFLILLLAMLAAYFVYTQNFAADKTVSPADPSATAAVPWETGETILTGPCFKQSNCYRKFLGVTDQGKVLIQDFYASGPKATDPYTVLTPQDAGLPFVGTTINADTLSNEPTNIDNLFSKSPGIDGLHVIWSENGQKLSEAHYQQGSALPSFATFWYPSNSTKLAEWTFQADGQNGFTTLWYESGQKLAEIHSIGNPPQPSQMTVWFSNGQKQYEFNFHNGKVHGPLKEWYANGHQKTDASFQNGDLHGLMTTWHPNGQKQSEGYFQDGKSHGLVTTWNENGQKRSEIVFDNDKVVERRMFN